LFQADLAIKTFFEAEGRAGSTARVDPEADQAGVIQDINIAMHKIVGKCGGFFHRPMVSRSFQAPWRPKDRLDEVFV